MEGNTIGGFIVDSASSQRTFRQKICKTYMWANLYYIENIVIKLPDSKEIQNISVKWAWVKLH